MTNRQCSEKPSDRSWLTITCAVIVIHSLVIGWSVYFGGMSLPLSQPKVKTYLAVQTIALESNPIPSNRIPSNTVTPTPIPPVRTPPTPLEQRTMWPPEPILQPTPLEHPAPKERPIPVLRPEKGVPVPVQPVPVPVTPVQPVPVPVPVTPVQPVPVPVPVTPVQPVPVPVKTVQPVPVPVSPPQKTEPASIQQNVPASKTPIQTALEKANEEFKAKQQEISIKKKQELEMMKAQQQEAFKRREEETLKKKKEQEAAKKKQASQLAEKQRQQKLIAEAQESIAKIGENKDNLAAKKTTDTLSEVPKAMTDLKIDSLFEIKGDISLSSYVASYGEELVTRLKLLLRLPEYGDVKVNLTLDRAGKVSKVAILNADSMKNRSYIEKILPELSFPPFGTHYASAAEYTFSITLSNEI